MDDGLGPPRAENVRKGRLRRRSWLGRTQKIILGVDRFLNAFPFCLEDDGFGAGAEIENQRRILLPLTSPCSVFWLCPAHSEMSLSAIPTLLAWWIQRGMPLSAIPTGCVLLLAWLVRVWAFPLPRRSTLAS